MSNKLVVILIVLNAIVLIALVWLIGMLTGMNLKENATAAAEKVVRERFDMATANVAPASPMNTPATRIAEQPEPIAPAAQFASTDFAPTSATQRLSPDAPLGGDLERQNSGYVLRGESEHRYDQIAAYIESAFAGTATANTADADYAEAVRELKRKADAPQPAPEVPRDVAVTQPVRPQKEKRVDHYNKVDVSQPLPSRDKEPSIEQRLEQVASLALTPDSSEPLLAEDDDNGRLYLYSLEEEVRQRVNEARTVVVERGDTLWKIALRAYGDGNLYPKIFAANPQLKSPNQIEVGDNLRVPL
ncbi:MAG: LysM peptidoglycan-binding domain-containing protein [Thiotrichales bacterium]